MLLAHVLLILLPPLPPSLPLITIPFIVNTVPLKYQLVLSIAAVNFMLTSTSTRTCTCIISANWL